MCDVLCACRLFCMSFWVVFVSLNVFSGMCLWCSACDKVCGVFCMQSVMFVSGVPAL